MGEIRSFSAILQQPVAVTGLRAAAGLWIGNHAFRDCNPNLYTGTKLGQDGLTWSLSKFRGWYYVGSAINDAYGNYAGAKSPRGAYDALTAYMATTSTVSGHTIAADHLVLAQTIFSDPTAFASLYQGHYDKPITLALLARIYADITIGTNLQAWLGCYSAAGACLGAVELVFEDEGEAGASPSWSYLLAHTASGLPAATHTVQLHLGINSPDSGQVFIELGDTALMLNPTNTDRAVDPDPVLFVSLGSVVVQRTPQMSWNAVGITDRRMLDGRLVRTGMIKDGLKFQFSASWTKVSDAVYQKLLSVWNLSTRGLGAHVPAPVPVCIDFGLGQAPFFGYFHVDSAGFAGTFHPHWTLGGQGYDISLTFQEV